MDQDANVLHDSQSQAYDAACKRVLSEKSILAWIIKSCLDEYRDCSIQEISNSVGFEDPFYFSRAFKEIKGVSPRQYANQARGKQS